MCESTSLTGIRVVDREANRSAAYFSASGEDAPFVVAPVIAVQYNPSRLVSDHDDDLIFEQHRQPERIGVERPRLGQVRDEEDKALKVASPHEVNLAEGRRSGMTAKIELDRRLARIEALLIAANGKSPGPAIRKQLISLAVSVACVPAGQDRPDDPQDREDEADQAQHPMALPEAENAQDQQQDKIDDA